MCSLRCVGKDETNLPPAAAGCTFAAHTHRLTEQSLTQAKQRIDAAVATCRRRDAEAAVYDHLLDLAEQHGRLQKRALAMSAVLANGTAHTETTHESDADLASRRADADRAGRAVREIEPTLAGLRPLAAARAAGRWWTLAWWRATGEVGTRLAEAEAKYGQAATYAAAVEQEVEGIAATRANLVAEQVAKRRAELADEAAAVDRELALVADKWQQAVRTAARRRAGPGRAERRRRRRRPRRLGRAAGTRTAATGLRPSVGGRAGAAGRGDAGPAVGGGQSGGGDAGGAGGRPALRRRPPRAVRPVDRRGGPRRGDADLLAAARQARRWVLIGEPEAVKGHLSEPEPSEGF